MPDLKIDATKTALLIMDYQNIAIEGHGPKGEDSLPKAGKVLDKARKAGIPVIYVVVGFREGYPEISDRNMRFRGLKNIGVLQAGSEGAAIPSTIAPKPGDVVVTKRRVGAFQGTDLATVLRARDITTLVMFGISTGGVVLATGCYADDADYDLVLLKDLCSDADADVHRVLVDKVFPTFMNIATSDDFLKAV